MLFVLLYKMKAGDTAATTTPCSVIGSDIAIAGSAHPPNNIIEDAHNIMIKHREWRVIPKKTYTPKQTTRVREHHGAANAQ